MALMWIGSFYLYGAGAAKLGRWGAIAGWPLFISLSIVVGNLWGLWRGEWQGAPALSRRLLNQGLLVLIVAVHYRGAQQFILGLFSPCLCDRVGELCENRPAHVVEFPIPVDLAAQGALDALRYRADPQTLFLL